MNALAKILMVGVLATLLFRSCSAARTKKRNIKNYDVCESQLCKCSGDSTNKIVDCTTGQFCSVRGVGDKESVSCINPDVVVADNAVCDKTDCICGLSEDKLSYHAMCEKDQKCFIKGQTHYCAKVEKKVEEKCTEDLDCYYQNPASTDGLSSTTCEKDETGYVVGEKVLCAKSKVKFGETCASGPCLCTFENGGKTAISRINEKQICLNSQKAAVGAEKVIGQGALCDMPSCYCSLGAELDAAKMAANDRLKNAICAKDEKCGSNTLKTFALCGQTVIKIGQQCVSSGNCICEDEHAPEVKAAYSTMVLSGDTCLAYQKGTVKDVIGATITDPAHPTLVENGVCVPTSAPSACLCELTFEQAIKQAVCTLNEICTKDKGEAVCAKMSAMEGKKCELAQCECSEKAGDNTATCKTNSFCVRRPDFSCVPVAIKSGEVCKDAGGCFCHDAGFFAKPDPNGPKLRAYEVCQNGFTCVDDNEGVIMKCIKGEVIAVGKSGAADSICQVKDRAVFCKAGLECQEFNGLPVCISETVAHSKMCKFAVCMCKPTKPSNPSKICVKGDQCWASSPEGTAECLRKTIEPSQICEKQEGCGCWASNKFRPDDYPKTVTCRQGQFCMQIDSGPTCVEPVTDMKDFSKPATEKGGLACAFTNGHSRVSVSCHMGQTCQYTPKGGAFCADPAFELPIKSGQICPNFSYEGCKCNAKTSCNAGHKCGYPEGNDCKIPPDVDIYQCPQGVHCHCGPLTSRARDKKTEFCFFRGGLFGRAYLTSNYGGNYKSDYVFWGPEKREAQILELVQQDAYSGAFSKGRNRARNLARKAEAKRGLNKNTAVRVVAARSLLVRI